MKVFSGTANKELAERIAKELGIALSEFEIFVFPDGERRVQVRERVVEEDCIIIQPTSPPVDQNYMELFFMIDSLKRSGARKVTVVSPYLGYQRQDHVFRDGEAVSLEVIRSTLESTGLNKIVVFDLHTIKTPEIFTIDFVHLSALELFAKTIAAEHLNTSSSLLISPDMGGIRRIEILSKLLHNMPYATINKNRDLNSGKVEANELVNFQDNASYTSALIVDDMISSGKTIVAAVDLLRTKGISNIYVFATHPVFSDEAKELLGSSHAKKIFVTDGIYVPVNKRFPTLHILSLAPLIAKELSSS